MFVLNLANKARSLDAKELAKMKISEIAKLVADKNIDIRDILSMIPMTASGKILQMLLRILMRETMTTS